MAAYPELALTLDLKSLAFPFAATCISISVACCYLAARRRTLGPQPPQLHDTIPFLTNTYQYLTDVAAFYDRVTYDSETALTLTGILTC